MLQAEESARLRAQGEQSAQEAEAAREQAEQSQKIADAQAHAASLARKEAELAEATATDLRKRLQDMHATRGAEGMQMTLDDIAFAPGQSSLRPAAKASLDKSSSLSTSHPPNLCASRAIPTAAAASGQSVLSNAVPMRYAMHSSRLA